MEEPAEGENGGRCVYLGIDFGTSSGFASARVMAAEDDPGKLIHDGLLLSREWTFAASPPSMHHLKERSLGTVEKAPAVHFGADMMEVVNINEGRRKYSPSESPQKVFNGQGFSTTIGGARGPTLDEDEGPEWSDTESDDERWSNSSSVTHEPIRNGKRKSIDDDDLITKLAPLIRRQFQDALLPLVSALRSREEHEQKHREQMLALEVEKLALEREKLILKRRRVALSQPAPPRMGPSRHKKRHALRVRSHAL